MNILRKILAIVDPTTAAQPGVNKAARLARASGAQLELFICDNSPELRAHRFIAGEIYEAAIADRRARHYAFLEQLACPQRQLGLRVTTDVVFEDPLHEAIVKKIQALQPDLVVKDTHYHGPMRRAFFTNTDWYLIRECAAPLLLTKPAAWRGTVNLAAAVDPGHADDKPASLDHEILATTETLANYLRSEAHAVHIFDSVSFLAAQMPPAPQVPSLDWADAQFIESLRRAHRNELDALLASHPAFAAHLDFIEGTPALNLPDYAVEKAIDVMVLGAVARTTLQRIFIGSTAERILDRMPCDLLVVKPSRVIKQIAQIQHAA